jgi:uncharacterized protein (TIGR01777 family)
MQKRLSILVTGASGLVGRPLCAALEKKQHSVRRLSRSSGDCRWDPERGELDPDVLDGIDVVVHLAGETVAQRWSREVKRRILDSRVKGAHLLAERILASGRKIDYVSASGINYYGYESADPVDESSAQGAGFLARVCGEWEGAAQRMIDHGQRCVFVRTGVVLSADGGALQKLLPPFKAGVGGPIGRGTQRMSWIALSDLVRIFERSVEDRLISGPVNAVAPHAVSNKDFAHVLGKVLKRPAIVPTPKFAISALFGEMGRETVLSDLNVVPSRLKESGFEWQLGDLEDCLKTTLSE